MRTELLINSRAPNRGAALVMRIPAPSPRALSAKLTEGVDSFHRFAIFPLREGNKYYFRF